MSGFGERVAENDINGQNRVNWIWKDRSGVMSAVLSPIVSEFETQEQADSYDRWFRAKVQAAMDDPRPSIPHDQAMAKFQALLDEKRKARAVG